MKARYAFSMIFALTLSGCASGEVMEQDDEDQEEDVTSAAAPAVAGCSTTVGDPYTGYRKVNGVNKLVAIAKATVTCSSAQSSLSVTATIQKSGGQPSWSASNTCTIQQYPGLTSCWVEAWYSYSSGTWTAFGSSPQGGTAAPKSKSL